MKWNVTLLLAATAIAATMAGCDNKSGESASPGASAAPGAAPSGGAVKTEAAPAAAPEKAKGLPVNEFLAKLAPTACSWMDQCKNDKVKVVTATMGMMIAGFGTMDKPELGAKVKGVGDAMKAEKRSLPNKQECEAIGGVVLQVVGMTPEVFGAKVGKTVQYDEAKGAACLASFQGSTGACATEFKISGEPKLSEIDGFQKDIDKEMDAQTKACEGAISGMVEVGAACEYDFECKGEHSKCKGAAGSKKCEAGKEKK